MNQPDLVLFVGEALVGNEAVDQLSKFNQALADYSQSTEPRLIDGIILTKFDTIDDKVGLVWLFFLYRKENNDSFREIFCKEKKIVKRGKDKRKS